MRIVRDNAGEQYHLIMKFSSASCLIINGIWDTIPFNPASSMRQKAGRIVFEAVKNAPAQLSLEFQKGGKQLFLDIYA